MSEHTKGPWYLTMEEQGEGYHVQSASINEDNYICKADTEQDAQLIASAPELLKALMDIIKNIENDNLEEFLIEAKDVIKKAQGG